MKSKALNIEIGDKAKDIVTGIEGIVVVRHDHLYGIARIAIQPEGSFEGKPHEPVHLDILQAKIVKKKAVDRQGGVAKKVINLGSEARCRITGFEGVCVGRAEWLYSCTKVLIQPRKLLEKTGLPVDSQWFDEGQIELIKQEKEKPQKTGGPGGKVSSFKVCPR
jgi:hypothetical protein